MAELQRTCLHDMHLALGARMVEFAGYEMPVQYPAGVLKEHLSAREGAGLFDVSHMGQAILRPPSGKLADAALALETLVPTDVAGLKPGRQRYALFTNDEGGIEDDLMVANRGDHLLLVVNAARKANDLALMRERIGDRCRVEEIADRALLALQGPAAETALARLAPEAAEMRFMDTRILRSGFGDLWASRSGYTGEDGFEISVDEQQARGLADALLAMDEVSPIGLGARDSLRLEAGLCLYGSDIDTTTSPVEAGLSWAIQKSRRAGGDRAGGFPGAERILRELERGPARLRVGLLPDGRAPMRAGTRLHDAEEGGSELGSVTSGAFGPSIGRPMSMGYVDAACAGVGTAVWGDVRGKRLSATVAEMPFRPSTYKR